MWLLEYSEWFCSRYIFQVKRPHSKVYVILVLRCGSGLSFIIRLCDLQTHAIGRESRQYLLKHASGADITPCTFNELAG